MHKLYKYFNVALVAGLCASASATIVINELDSDTPGGDADEFVELKGNPNESANGLVLVFYQGSASNQSYHTIDLNGFTCDANGYLLIADTKVQSGGEIPQSNGFIKNTECALALFQDVASNYPNGTTPTSANLKDVVVYRAIAPAGGDWSGFGTTPPVYLEGNNNAASAVFSLSRVPDATGSWIQSTPTPRAINVAAPQSIDISNSFQRPRYNQFTVQVPSVTNVTLKNNGSGLVTVSKLELATTASAEVSTVSPATPSLPVTLNYNESVTLALQLVDSNPAANKTYNLVVNYQTDTATSPSGSYTLSPELVRVTNAAAANTVLVNEICFNPGTVDHNNDGGTAGQNDEFVELFNTTNASILIEGWEQRCSDGLTGTNFQSYVFPAGATIPANGYVTVFTSGNPTGFLPGTTFTYGTARIANGGARVEINDGTTIIDGLAYGNAEDSPDADAYTNTGVLPVAGNTFGRRPDGAESFMVFDLLDGDGTNNPSPNTTNNVVSGIKDWALF